MSRVPKSRDLAKLAQLTRARELAALAELSRIASARRTVENDIAALRAEDHTAETTAEMRIVETWRLWKAEELRRRSIRLAALTAAYQEAASRCGRLVAENTVVEKLQMRSRRLEAKSRESRAVLLTSPDERYP